MKANWPPRAARPMLLKLPGSKWKRKRCPPLAPAPPGIRRRLSSRALLDRTASSYELLSRPANPGRPLLINHVKRNRTVCAGLPRKEAGTKHRTNNRECAQRPEETPCIRPHDEKYQPFRECVYTTARFQVPAQIPMIKSNQSLLRYLRDAQTSSPLPGWT